MNKGFSCVSNLEESIIVSLQKEKEASVNAKTTGRISWLSVPGKVLGRILTEMVPRVTLSQMRSGFMLGMRYAD